MVKIKPFAAVRPPKAIAAEVSARPYDVMNSEEASAGAGMKSLLHITRPEIDFQPIAGEDEDRVYAKAVENFNLWQERGWLFQDKKECFYLYSISLADHTQCGIVLCANIEDYARGAIRRHELTRKEKEENRLEHILRQKANLEPVFFSYPDNAALQGVMDRHSSEEAEYDFTVEADGSRHRLWIIDDDQEISLIQKTFAGIEAMYIADGHHRTAATVRAGNAMKAANPNHRGDEEYNYFLAVCFPQSQLKIIDYNRVVKDTCGLNAEEFLSELSLDFVVRDMGEQIYRTEALHEISMYYAGRWYSLKAKEGTFDENDPVDRLDTSICTKLILDKILHIGDLRVSDRIDFVGGNRGLEELKRRVDSGEMAAAFALFPVTMEQIVDIADSGNIMPPKTTWFEPKLRSGLAIHKLYR